MKITIQKKDFPWSEIEYSEVTVIEDPETILKHLNSSEEFFLRPGLSFAVGKSQQPSDGDEWENRPEGQLYSAEILDRLEKEGTIVCKPSPISLPGNTKSNTMYYKIK